jgi:Zn-dependent protease with chaperone function
MTSPGEPDEQSREFGAGAASNARLALLVFEGYAYLLLIIGVFVGAIALLLWGILARRPLIALAAIFFGIPLVITTISAIRSLFFRLPQPQGIPVTARQAPALHSLVEQLRRQIQAPPVHRILVGEPFNASAIQLPRIGIFWPRNTLLIGYPLLVSLSPEQLRAVIAHELGHLSRAHGRFSVWVYRTRLSWVRLMDNLQARRATPAHAYWLFGWYAPRLHAYSAAIARQQELLADRCAAEVAGGRIAADALVALAAGGSVFDRPFWRAVFDKVEREPEPPRPFAKMGSEIWNAIAADAANLMDHLLDSHTEPGDSHPSLRDRLKALGEEARLPRIPEQTAGAAYLGPQMELISAALDAQWQAARGAEWRSRHHALRKNRQRLGELAGLDAPTPEEMFEYGQLAEQLQGVESALPHYRAAVDRGHPRATLATGRILLDRDDETGVALIERAIDADPTLVPEGCEQLIYFFRNRNRLTEAHRYLLRSTREATRGKMAETERNHVSAFDRFAPHGLGGDELSAIVACLTRESEVLQAFIAAKELRYSTGAQLVLAIVTRGVAAQGLPEQIRSHLLLAENTTIVVLNHHDQLLRAALEGVPGSRIYARAAP